MRTIDDLIHNLLFANLKDVHAAMKGTIAAQLNSTDAARMTKADACKYIDGVFAVISEAAAAGDEIAFSGFGKFKVKATTAREGRNPSTGVPIQIAASKKLTFAPAKAIKDQLGG